jgi:topoisomerase-4 subunit B
MRDHFDHFLSDNMDRGRALLGYVLDRMDDRLRRKQEKEVKRKTPLRPQAALPGKLTDCANDDPPGTELFIVEGDSAGRLGQAGARAQDQAILPIRGKISTSPQPRPTRSAPMRRLPTSPRPWAVAHATAAIPTICRYEKIVIMTDADVDGAHIATC